MGHAELKRRALEYLSLKGTATQLLVQLGFGEDGAVWQTDDHTAVKALERSRNYDQELACYDRLSELGREAIGEFMIPVLIDACDELLVLELQIVEPPFLLDFGKAYLDAPPTYASDPDFMAEWHQQYAQLWNDRWPTVQSLLWQLRQMGIYYYDPKPGNIMFGDE